MSSESNNRRRPTPEELYGIAVCVEDTKSTAGPSERASQGKSRPVSKPTPADLYGIPVCVEDTPHKPNNPEGGAR